MDFKESDRLMFMAIQKKILTENNPMLNAIVRKYAIDNLPVRIKLFNAETVSFTESVMKRGKNG